MLTPAATAPASARGAVAEVDRSHTVTGKPADSNLRAMADPIIPAPSTATALTWPPLATIAKPLPGRGDNSEPNSSPGRACRVWYILCSFPL